MAKPDAWLRVSNITGRTTGVFLPDEDIELRSETLRPLVSIGNHPLDLARAVFRLDLNSRVHGEPHWAQVLNNGLFLADRMPEVDRTVVEWFAWLHDCARMNDDADPGHGRRAVTMLHGMQAAGLLPLKELQLGTLLMAIDGHSAGHTTQIPTVGACWDADRLDLWRVGIRPDPEFMSTDAGKRLAERRQK